MIHPSVFLILHQNKVTDVINETEQSVNIDSNAIKGLEKNRTCATNTN